ncbi:hypothetical protein PR202_gb21172 [Eleusine coracana subsp. coracana]|uniref:Pentatricopeptide repeat-containing protein n=1 Tax=Eleusine coracana subsp. coracana TaxID=191504 RepID=A0AAV5FAH7_ELECO|nr:hypothetical protein PR202_gb21172 [Eleusine coracana subsp. coracana]
MRDQSKNQKPTQRGRYLNIEVIQAVQYLKRAVLRGSPAASDAVEPKLRPLLKVVVAVFHELGAQGEAFQVCDVLRHEQSSLYLAEIQHDTVGFAVAMATPRANLARLLLHLRRRCPKIQPPFSASSSSPHGLLAGSSLWPPPPSSPSPGGAWRRAFHDGRPRGPLWRSKKLIGKEALFAIQGLKRFKGDEEKLADFVKRHVARLLKADKLAVLGELERQEEVNLAVKVSLLEVLSCSSGSEDNDVMQAGVAVFIVKKLEFIEEDEESKGFAGRTNQQSSPHVAPPDTSARRRRSTPTCSRRGTSPPPRIGEDPWSGMGKDPRMFRIIQKEDWYKPDMYMYKDLIIALAKCKKMDEAMVIWGNMRDENLFPDSQTYAEVIRGFLRYGSPSDAMNIYEDMKKSPDPPEELPFRVLLKGLLPHPLLRNRVKQDFEELFPERHIYDPPEEIFGMQ